MRSSLTWIFLNNSNFPIFGEKRREWGFNTENKVVCWLGAPHLPLLKFQNDNFVFHLKDYGLV